MKQCVAAVLVVLAGSARGEDWPQFRGPDGLGVSAAKVPLTWSATENVAWKAELPGAGTSSPVVVGGKVFLTCYSGYNVPGGPRGSDDLLKRHVVCLGLEDGKVLWTKDVASKLPEQERIRDDHGYASNTPAADGERVYAFFGKSGVFALDHGGRPLWHAEVGSDLRNWGSAASPVLAGDLVLVNASVESQSLVALDSKTGKEVWRARNIRESWNTPLFVPVKGGKTELVVAVMGKVLGLDPATGERLWSCDTDIPWYMVPSLVAADGIVYCIGGRTGGSLAVRAGGRGDVTRTHRVWKATRGSNVSSPVLHDGHLYFAHENRGIAYCLEAKTGRVVYEERLRPAPGDVYASAVLAGGRVYYVARHGGTFVVPAAPSFELLARNTLGDRSTFNASPAVAGGRLLLRSDRYLYCIGER